MISVTNSAWALEASERLAAISAVISSAEYLARPAMLSDAGLGSWKVAQLERRWLSARLFQSTFGRLAGYPAVKTLIAIRLCSAALLALGLFHSSLVLLTLTGSVIVVSIVLVVRSQYGHDGADQMMLICFISYFIAHGTGVTGPALWLIAGQSCLAYITAGLAKALSPVWRSGKALPGVLRAENYGNRAVYTFLKYRPKLSSTVCCSVVAFECLFPLAIAGVWQISLALIAIGFLFHMANAFVMRLNTFFWSFLATYPPILYCSAVVARWRFGIG